MPPFHDPPNTPNSDLSPILPGRPGRRSFSLEAIRERIEAEFIEETTGRADILADAETPDAQRSMIEDVADYVLAIENLFVPPREKAMLIETLRQRLFSFGPLDEFLSDDQITEIAIEGPHAVHIREGMGKLTFVSAAFDDAPHLTGVLARILAPAGIDLAQQPPALETGLTLAGRRARLSLIGPPISPHYTVNIRLHPRQPLSLDALIRQHELIPPEAAPLLRAIVRAGHGLLIVAESGTGKTALLNALMTDFRDPARLAVVARAAEIVPPQNAPHAIMSHLPDPTSGDLTAPIRAALDGHPAHLVIDELRGTEAAGLWAALKPSAAPQLLIAMRGSHDITRLRSALTMTLRQADPTGDPAEQSRALIQRLPFVMTLRRACEGPHLDTLAEWTLDDEDDTALVLTPLYLAGKGLTHHRPHHDLSDERPST